jgi:hypothetical protein
MHKTACFYEYEDVKRKCTRLVCPYCRYSFEDVHKEEM